MNKQIDPSPSAKIVIGSIGLLFGVVRVLTAVLGGLGPGAGAYRFGQVMGVIVAGAVGYFGARYLLRGIEERKGPQAKRPAQMQLPSVPERPKPVETVSGSVPPPRS
jgi:hypothetical protein